MNSRQGVTLVELVIVITILGVMAWIAFPNFAPFHEIKLDAAARRVAADLRYAQSRAIGRRIVHGILFEPSAERYTVFAPNAASPLIDPIDRSGPMRVDFTSGGEFQGVAISSATFGSTTGVTFDFFGVPRDTAGVELAAVGRIVLTYQGLVDTIEVTPATGRVSVR